MKDPKTLAMKTLRNIYSQLGYAQRKLEESDEADLAQLIEDVRPGLGRMARDLEKRLPKAQAGGR